MLQVKTYVQFSVCGGMVVEEELSKSFSTSKQKHYQEILKDMCIRVAQQTFISVKNSMTEGKRKLEWCRFRKYIRFLILFIPRSSNCKKPFHGFLEIYYTKSLMNLHHFQYFTQSKNPREKKIISFSGIPY